MEYIVLGQDGKEYGPVDGETLKKWVEHGRVYKDTQVRNSLMKKWNEAGKLDFLEGAFDVQEVHEEEEEGVGDKLFGMLGLKEDHEQSPERDVNTAFRHKYIPNPAAIPQRIGAFAFDSCLMLCFAILLFLLMNFSNGTMGFGKYESGPDSTFADSEVEDVDSESDNENGSSVSKKITKTEDESEDTDEESYEEFIPTEGQIYSLNSSFGTYFTIFAIGIFLYYGIALGVFAQTCGMWFWGIIIVKGYNDECFPARAFAFSVAMFAIGIVTPLVVLVTPQKRSLHGYLTGTRLIRVSAKPKA